MSKVKQLIFPYTEILAWCLMPNHFHFLTVVNSSGCELIQEKHRPNVQALSKNIGSLLSGYTRAINKIGRRKGRLFVHNTKAKCLNDEVKNDNILLPCFHYIHQNPLRAGLCTNLEEWEFSSYRDFAGLRNGKLVNKELAFELINYDLEKFAAQSKFIIDDAKIKGIF